MKWTTNLSFLDIFEGVDYQLTVPLSPGVNHVKCPRAAMI